MDQGGDVQTFNLVYVKGDQKLRKYDNRCEPWTNGLMGGFARPDLQFCGYGKDNETSHISTMI